MRKHDDIWLPEALLEYQLRERPESGIIDEQGNYRDDDDWERVYEGVEWE